MSPSAIMLLPGEGTITPDPLGLPRVRKASGPDTGGAYTLHESNRAPGQGAPPHVHPEHEEAFYLLSGTIDFTIGTKRLMASAGTFVSVPRGTLHAFEVAGDEPATYLCIFSPPPRAATGTEVAFAP